MESHFPAIGATLIAPLLCAIFDRLHRSRSTHDEFGDVHSHFRSRQSAWSRLLKIGAVKVLQLPVLVIVSTFITNWFAYNLTYKACTADLPVPSAQFPVGHVKSTINADHSTWWSSDFEELAVSCAPFLYTPPELNDALSEDFGSGQDLHYPTAIKSAFAVDSSVAAWNHLLADEPSRRESPHSDMKIGGSSTYNFMMIADSEVSSPTPASSNIWCTISITGLEPSVAKTGIRKQSDTAIMYGGLESQTSDGKERVDILSECLECIWADHDVDSGKTVKKPLHNHKKGCQDSCSKASLREERNSALEYVQALINDTDNLSWIDTSTDPSKDALQTSGKCFRTTWPRLCLYAAVYAMLASSFIFNLAPRSGLRDGPVLSEQKQILIKNPAPESTFGREAVLINQLWPLGTIQRYLKRPQLSSSRPQPAIWIESSQNPATGTHTNFFGTADSQFVEEFTESRGETKQRGSDQNVLPDPDTVSHEQEEQVPTLVESDCQKTSRLVDEEMRIDNETSTHFRRPNGEDIQPKIRTVPDSLASRFSPEKLHLVTRCTAHAKDHIEIGHTEYMKSNSALKSVSEATDQRMVPSAQGGSSRSPRSRSQQSGSAGGQRSRGKRKTDQEAGDRISKRKGRSVRRSLNNDGNDSDDGSDGGNNVDREETTLLLACPFWKAHAWKHLDCYKKVLRGIPELKQHLLRVHKAPDWYCFKCHEDLVSEEQYQAHFRADHCIEVMHDGPDLMKRDMQARIKKRTPGRHPRDTWYDIFKILFPELALPASPYLIEENPDCVEHISNLLRILRPETLQQVLCDLGQNKNGSSLPQQTERILAQALQICSRGEHGQSRINDIQEEQSFMSPLEDPRTANNTELPQLSNYQSSSNDSDEAGTTEDLQAMSQLVLPFTTTHTILPMQSYHEMNFPNMPHDDQDWHLFGHSYKDHFDHNLPITTLNQDWEPPLLECASEINIHNTTSNLKPQQSVPAYDHTQLFTSHIRDNWITGVQSFQPESFPLGHQWSHTSFEMQK